MDEKKTESQRGRSVEERESQINDIDNDNDNDSGNASGNALRVIHTVSVYFLYNS